jgi:hypothetical protein
MPFSVIVLRSPRLPADFLENLRFSDEDLAYLQRLRGPLLEQALVSAPRVRPHEDVLDFENGVSGFRVEIGACPIPCRRSLARLPDGVAAPLQAADLRAEVVVALLQSLLGRNTAASQRGVKAALACSPALTLGAVLRLLLG